MTMGIDADSLKAFSMASSGFGALLGAKGAKETATANSDAAMYQSAVARNNAILSERNAQQALAAGRTSEQTMRQRTAQTIGQQRAQMAANGLDISSGTPANIQADAARVGELDALTIRNNALRQAINFRQQASDYDSNAGFLDSRAANAKRAGDIGAFNSIVGGASSVADKWAKWQN